VSKFTTAALLPVNLNRLGGRGHLRVTCWVLAPEERTNRRGLAATRPSGTMTVRVQYRDSHETDEVSSPALFRKRMPSERRLEPWEGAGE
jgi:hypothetical protein